MINFIKSLFAVQTAPTNHVFDMPREYTREEYYAYCDAQYAYAMRGLI